MATITVQTRTAKSDGKTRYRVAYRREGSRKIEATQWMMSIDDATKVAKIMRTKGVDIALRLFSITKDDTNAPTLTEWLPKHIARKATRITPGTAAEYKRMAERTFLRTLGEIPADQLTEADIIDWVAWQLRQPTVAWEKKATKAAETGRPAPQMETYSPKSVRNAHGLLSAMLSTLEDAGHIKRNIAKGIDLPKDPPKESREIFTREEWVSFYDAMQDEYKPLTAFLLLTGARIGEATAVRVKDFDFKAQSVRIVQAWKKGERGTVLGAPKTRRSVRTILLGPEIENFRASCAGKGPDALVFTAPLGGQIHAHRFRERQWQRALEKAGLQKDLTPHCLRHTFASWALMAGVAPQVVQMRLGHESLHTTSTVYAHLLLEEQAAAVKAIGWDMPSTVPQ